MLPKPKKINLQAVMRNADACSDLVTFESSIRGMNQIIDNNRVLIVTSQSGLLIIYKKDIPQLIEELKNIYEWPQRT